MIEPSKTPRFRSTRFPFIISTLLLPLRFIPAKDPSPVEVYNDLDGGLHNFFSTLADPERFEKFYRRVALMPYSRRLYNECVESWEETEDGIERAARWFVVARQSFSGDFGISWSSVITESNRGMASTASKWLSAIERLPQVHARLQRVQIENQDFRVILDRYDTENTLFYLDPPYLPKTRSSGKYRHEMSYQDHKELVGIILSVKGMVLLSGYANDLYKRLEAAGWDRKDFKTACHAAGRTRNSNLQGDGAALKHQARVESVWRNRAAVDRCGYQMRMFK